MDDLIQLTKLIEARNQIEREITALIGRPAALDILVNTSHQESSTLRLKNPPLTKAVMVISVTSR